MSGAVCSSIVHQLVRFTDREPPDRKPVKIHCAEFLGRSGPEIKVGTALDNGEYVLIDPDTPGLVVTVVFDRLAGPLGGPLDRGSDPLLGCGERDQIVENHHDIAAEVVLDVDDFFGGKKMFAAVDVAAKFDSAFGGFGNIA